MDYVRYELQDVTDMALRSGVIFNTVDVRGLYTTNYQASDRVVAGHDKRPLHCCRGSRKCGPMICVTRRTHYGSFPAKPEVCILETQTISQRACAKLCNSQSFYYILSYATPNAKSDGRYHKIKLEVTRPGLKVTYRKGYYAPKEQISFERRKKEDIIEALRAPGNLNEIPIQLSYNYFQVDDARYQLALLTQVNIRGMKFVEEDSRHRNLISLVVVALDENDQYIDGLEKTIDLNLTGPSYSALF